MSSTDSAVSDHSRDAAASSDSNRQHMPPLSVSGAMNTRVVVGVILLVIAAVIFYLEPATSVTSTGTQVIYWENILPGAVLAVLGIVLLATGRRTSPK